MYHLLDDYPYNNVYVFDYYNVLTSKGGSYEVNDLGLKLETIIDIGMEMFSIP